MIRSYKIESYVPEQSFLSGKDARFCRAAFEDCFVVDIHNGLRVIASSNEIKSIELSIVDTASLLTLFDGSDAFSMLPYREGTLMVYPAWPKLEIALAFLLKENLQTVEKAYQTAKRYAFSRVFNAEQEDKNSPPTELEAKLCTLQFYMHHLFGENRQTNVSAQILMIANLMGCKLHEMSVSHVNVTLDEEEMGSLGAYLFCTFMTLRRYNGRVSATEETEEKPSILTHVPQEYGIRIQQSIKEKATKPSLFDLPLHADIASFASHPAFADCKIEEADGTLRLHLPLKKKALLSSVSAYAFQNELLLTLFPI